MIRERIIRIHYEDTALDFITDATVGGFQNMLGKITAYSMRSRENDGIEFVDVSINAAGEVAFALYPPLSWKPDGSPDDHEPFYALSTAIDALRSEDPTIQGAAPLPSGDYRFH